MDDVKDDVLKMYNKFCEYCIPIKCEDCKFNPYKEKYTCFSLYTSYKLFNEYDTREIFEFLDGMDIKFRERCKQINCNNCKLIQFFNSVSCSCYSIYIVAQLLKEV